MLVNLPSNSRSKPLVYHSPTQNAESRATAYHKTYTTVVQVTPSHCPVLNPSCSSLSHFSKRRQSVSWSCRKNEWDRAQITRFRLSLFILTSWRGWYPSIWKATLSLLGWALFRNSPKARAQSEIGRVTTCKTLIFRQFLTLLKLEVIRCHNIAF